MLRLIWKPLKAFGETLLAVKAQKILHTSVHLKTLQPPEITPPKSRPAKNMQIAVHLIPRRITRLFEVLTKHKVSQKQLAACCCRSLPPAAFVVLSEWRSWFYLAPANTKRKIKSATKCHFVKVIYFVGGWREKLFRFFSLRLVVVVAVGKLNFCPYFPVQKGWQRLIVLCQIFQFWLCSFSYHERCTFVWLAELLLPSFKMLI